MRRTQFKAQAALGFAVVITLAMASLVAALFVYRLADERRDQRLGDYAEDVRIASELRFHSERMIAAARGYLLTGDRALLRNVATAEQQLDDASRRLGQSSTSPEMTAELQEIRESVGRYREALDALVSRAPAPTDQSAIGDAVETQLLPKSTDLDRRLQAFSNRTELLLTEERNAAEKASANLLWLTSAIGGVGALLAAIAAWLVARRLDQLYAREADATSRAERAVAARDEVMAIVAHDLRTPLNAMVLKASLIRKGEHDSRTLKFAESIEAIGLRMEVLIKSLLDAASIEAGHFTVACERGPVSELIESTLDVFRPLAAEREVSLEADVTPPELVIRCDRERISQALSNLVGNALKFTSGQGTIRVGAALAGANVHFEVSDTGSGIASEHLPHIFDRYWRPDHRDRRGSGLGLYITKGIVEAHGGRIWVDSTEGRGTSFHFEVPVAPLSAVSSPVLNELRTRSSPAH